MCRGCDPNSHPPKVKVVIMMMMVVMGMMMMVGMIMMMVVMMMINRCDTDDSSYDDNDDSSYDGDDDDNTLAWFALHSDKNFFSRSTGIHSYNVPMLSILLVFWKICWR